MQQSAVPRIRSLYTALLEAARLEGGRNVVRLVGALMRSGDVLLDIGADDATLALQAAHRAGPLGHVHLLEPPPHAIDRLDAAVRAAGPAHVTLHERALHGLTQRLMAHLVGDRPFGARVDLAAVTPAVLDDLLAFARLRFVVFEGGHRERWWFGRLGDSGFAVFGLKRVSMRCRVERVDDFAQWPRYRDFVAVRCAGEHVPPSLHPQRLGERLDDRAANG